MIQKTAGEGGGYNHNIIASKLNDPKTSAESYWPIL